MENEFVLSGIIDKFTMQFELAWKLLQRALRYEGRLDASTGSPRGVLKTAYSAYDFMDEKLWLAMLDGRKASEHVYDSELAVRLVGDIISSYIPAFDNLLAHLEALYSQELLETF